MFVWEWCNGWLKFLGGRSVLGGIVTGVTEYNCGSNSVVDFLGRFRMAREIFC
jgi:hypothetical protein